MGRVGLWLVWLVLGRYATELAVTSSFFLFSNPPELAAFISATTMAPQRDAAQHILIESLLNKGFETKLIAKMNWNMNAVLMNLDLRGSTMGSRKEFKDMVAFVNEKKMKPVVSRLVKGLDNLKEIDTLFDDMKTGSKFEKLVIEIGGSASSKL